MSNPNSKASRYVVRAHGGELTYETRIHLEQAYLAGLVEPDDEVSVEGSGTWRRAAEMPELASLRRAEHALAGAYVPWIGASVILAVAALIFLIRGPWYVGLALALLLSAVLYGLTYKTSRLKRTR